MRPRGATIIEDFVRIWGCLYNMVWSRQRDGSSYILSSQFYSLWMLNEILQIYIIQLFSMIIYCLHTIKTHRRRLAWRGSPCEVSRASPMRPRTSPGVSEQQSVHAGWRRTDQLHLNRSRQLLLRYGHSCVALSWPRRRRPNETCHAPCHMKPKYAKIRFRFLIWAVF